MEGKAARPKRDGTLKRRTEQETRVENGRGSKRAEQGRNVTGGGRMVEARGTIRICREVEGDTRS